MLKPGGRISIFEPVADIYMALGKKNSILGLEVDVSDEIRQKVAEGRRSVNEGKDSTLLGFDDRDFFRWCDECGFAEIDIELNLTKQHKPAPPIEHFLHSRPNPLASTLDEIMHAVLSKEERRDLRNAMNKAILNGVTDYMALMYLTAAKKTEKQQGTIVRVA